MATTRTGQTNIRSDIVRRRIREVRESTGMSATQFLEEAVLLHNPLPEPLPPGVYREGWLLVASLGDSRTITLDDINDAILRDRIGERD